MAIKSNNTKGNPYHDEKTGEFVSQESSNNKNQTSEQLEQSKFLSIRFKPNIDINSAKQELQNYKKTVSTQVLTTGKYREAKSVEEAVAIGKEILPSCEVNYSQNCYLPKLNELNNALSDVVNKFPSFVKNGLLNAYGDGVSLSEETLHKVIQNSALNVIQNDPYFKQQYEDYFEKVRWFRGFTEEKKFSLSAISSFMCFDNQFDINEYINKGYGGGTLAYYQVSQRKIFGVGEGGKGINGAIKFYNSILQEPTQKEINENKNSVETGFHFDFGGKGYTYATAIHELGHSVFTIAYKKCTQEEREELDGLLREGMTTRRHQVSGYGRHNAYEQEAEAFTDGMCRGKNASPHNKKMFGWLEKVHNRLVQNGEN